MLDVRILLIDGVFVLEKLLLQLLRVALFWVVFLLSRWLLRGIPVRFPTLTIDFLRAMFVYILRTMC